MPVIAAVNGIGGRWRGSNLALVCDITIAAEKCRLHPGLHADRPDPRRGWHVGAARTRWVAKALGRGFAGSPRRGGVGIDSGALPGRRLEAIWAGAWVGAGGFRRAFRVKAVRGVSRARAAGVVVGVASCRLACGVTGLKEGVGGFSRSVGDGLPIAVGFPRVVSVMKTCGGRCFVGLGAARFTVRARAARVKGGERRIGPIVRIVCGHGSGGRGEVPVCLGVLQGGHGGSWIRT